MSEKKPQKTSLRLVGVRKTEDPHEEVKVLKAMGVAVQGNAFDPEDEFSNWYSTGADGNIVLQPPYNLRVLDRLSQENNTLLPCIEAMVENIEGTGYEFEPKDTEAKDGEDDANIKSLKDFFNEPWPGVTFIDMRKELRRDRERTGNSYLEIVRTAKDEVVMMRRIDAKMMRLVKLDAAAPVDKVLRRGGKDVTIKVMLRERRFCQLVNGVSLIYFKEFGASRELDKYTGNWAKPGEKLPADRRATEILHEIALPDAHTGYGVPRWINQLPSVLGSRKAEEFNLEFFDEGGLPPIMILLQGGTLQADTRKAIEAKMLGGTASQRNRVQVLEVEPTSGALNEASKATIQVERFGGDRTTDSMFDGYDDKCEVKVRRSFRLPPIFIGAAQDYTFASAFASYTVAEAQVFKPERDKEDAVFTMKVLPALGHADYKITSKPLVIEDATLKLQGIQVAVGTQLVDKENLIAEINEATGTNLKIASPEDLAADKQPVATHTVDAEGNIVPINDNKAPLLNQADQPPAKPKKKPQNKEPTPVQKAVPAGVVALAKDLMIALRQRDIVSVNKNIQIFNSLDAHGQEACRKATAELAYINPDFDAVGMGQLAGCTIEVMRNQCCGGHA